MAEILAVSANGPLRARWGRALAAAKHRVRLLSPETLEEAAKQPAGTLCLYDLGEHGGADTSGLRRAMTSHPSWRFAAMTAVPAPEEGIRLLRAGARAYCNRRISEHALRAAVAAILDDEIWAGRQVTEHLLHHGASPPAIGTDPPLALELLTKREREIALLVRAGFSNKVIAAESGVSERTVKTHLHAIYRKTGIRNRVQLALILSQLSAPSGQLAQG